VRGLFFGLSLEAGTPKGGQPSGRSSTALVLGQFFSIAEGMKASWGSVPLLESLRQIEWSFCAERSLPGACEGADGHVRIGAQVSTV